jgi:predicted RNase H-like nuclease (RuvC/YqgF family)
MTTPTYDLTKIRKAYNRVQDALTQAKADGDQELIAKYRSDFLALKQLLADAKDAQAAESTETTRDLRREIKDLKAQLAAAEETVKTQRTTISGLKYEMEIIKDEVRTLRAPAPTQAYRQVQNLKPAAATPNIDLDAAFNELFGEAR